MKISKIKLIGENILPYSYSIFNTFFHSYNKSIDIIGLYISHIVKKKFLFIEIKFFSNNSFK